MIVFKSLKYSCLRICNVDDAKIIDRICTCSKLTFQHESNKHCTKTGRNQKHTAQEISGSSDAVEFLTHVLRGDENSSFMKSGAKNSSFMKSDSV